MKESVLQRLKELIEFKKLSVNAFAKAVGVEQTTLNNQLLGKRALSLDVVLRTIEVMSDVSAEWLLRGEGNMLKTAESTFKYDLPEEEDCMGSFACTRPISPKVDALEDADRILADGRKEKALEDFAAIMRGGNSEEASRYLEDVIDRKIQERLMLMMERLSKVG